MSSYKCHGTTLAFTASLYNCKFCTLLLYKLAVNSNVVPRHSENDLKHNDTQYDTKHNDTQYDTKHEATKH